MSLKKIMSSKNFFRILIIVTILSDCFNNKLNWMCVLYVVGLIIAYIFSNIISVTVVKSENDFNIFCLLKQIIRKYKFLIGSCIMLNLVVIFIYKNAEIAINWCVGSIYFIMMVILFQIKGIWKINSVSRNVAFGRLVYFLMFPTLYYVVLIKLQSPKINNFYFLFSKVQFNDVSIGGLYKETLFWIVNLVIIGGFVLYLFNIRKEITMKYFLQRN